MFHVEQFGSFERCKSVRTRSRTTRTIRGSGPPEPPLPVSPRPVAESLEGVIFLPQASFGLEFGIKMSAVAPNGSGSKPWPVASMRKPKGIALAPYAGIPYNPMVLNQKSFLRIGCGRHLHIPIFEREPARIWHA